MSRHFSVVILFAFAVSYCHALSLGGIVDSIKSAFSGEAAPSYEAEGYKYKPAPRTSDRPASTYKQPEHAPGVSVVDHADHTLPRVRHGSRVVDLFHGMHFDDLLKDAPTEIRPPSLVAFYDSNDEVCMKRYESLQFHNHAESKLPARERLMVADYNMYAAPRRAWYEFTPEMDLETRFGVTDCPSIVFVPRKCDGWTEWCVQGDDPEDPNVLLVGCEDFKEQCTDYEFWNGKGNWVDWAQQKIDAEGEPQITPFLKTYKNQGEWLKKREHTTTNTHIRNAYLSHAFPGFTKTGYLAIETPKEMQDFMLEFHKENESKRRDEHWEAESTQLNYHESQTSFIDLDMVRRKKYEMADKYLRPVVEEWSGMSPLELTSFYGIREYHEDSWLREHIDRIDTHVLSVTFTIDKRNVPEDAQPWPLQVIRWDGKIVRYNHPPGTMVLYESSKLPHGRPYKNKSGTHLGAFLHYKPVVMNKAEAANWDDIAAFARESVRRHVKNDYYVQSRSVEPKNPVFTKQTYGKGTRWVEPGSKREPVNHFAVSFKNNSNRMLAVYWKGDTNVLQGHVAPGTKVEINTYLGHSFFWSEVDKEAPLPQGSFTIEAGLREYKYNVIDETANTGKWKAKLQEKFNTEAELNQAARAHTDL